MLQTELLKVKKEMEVKSSENIGQIIRSRRTIHSFRRDPIPESDLMCAIEAARWAPNHKMTEPWCFYRLGPKTVSQLADLNVTLFMTEKSEAHRTMKRAKWVNMPTTTVVTSTVGDGELRDKENYAATSCAIQNFQLFMWSKGIGVKWSTTKLTRAQEMYDLLGIDRSKEEIVGILWAGYPEEVPSRDRASVESCVVRLP